MKTGLVSATFRKLSPERIIDLCREAELDGIEWSTDVHAVNPSAASEIAEKLNGLEVISLGSYYKLGQGQDFIPVLETAKKIGAPNIRIWAGTENPDDVSKENRIKLVEEAKRISYLAGNEGMTLSFEYHGGTLTANQQSAVSLIEEINAENVRLYWQPLDSLEKSEMADNVRELSDRKILLNLHVYYWVNSERFPLSDGKEYWKQWFAAAEETANAALLEFVKDDSEAQFLKDAKTLKALIK